MESRFFDYNGARIHYLRFGNGPQILLALHGFGDTAGLFSVLKPALTDRYTVLAPDLPFHGQSNWPHATFSKHDMSGIIRKILIAENAHRFSLMGYSFGARILLACLPALLPDLDELILLAPEGLGTRGMQLATAVPMRVRKWLFKVLQHPEPLLGFLQKSRLAPAYLRRFLAFNLTRADRHRRLFACWFSLNHFLLNPAALKAQLRAAGTPLSIYCGANDDMVRLRPLQKLVRDLPGAQLIVLPETHRLVNAKLASILAASAPH